MATPAKASPGSRAAGMALVALALLVWVMLLPGLGSLSSSDAAGNAISQALTAIAFIILWILLAVLMAIAAWKGTMPAPVALAALILVPASGYAALTALDLLARPGIPPRYLPMIIPVLVPPLIVSSGLWALLPSRRAAVRDAIAAGIIWGAVLILSAAIIPMVHTRNAFDQREADRFAKFEADYASLPADSPLWYLTPFLDAPNQTTVSAVLDRIRARQSRQSEAETMLDRGDFPLRYLGSMDLDPTPGLCDKARNLLRRRVELLVPKVPDAEPYAKIYFEVSSALAAMKWLVGYECSCDAESLAWESMANAYRNPNFDVVELARLRDPKELGQLLREYPARFSMLSPRSNLKAWLGYADDISLREQALAGARKLDHRTADAIEMLKSNDPSAPWKVLKYLPDLELEANAALCTAALAQVREDLTKVYRPPSDDRRPYRELLDRLGAYAPLTALQWLAGHGCSAEVELTEAESVVGAYQDSPDRAAMLASLARLHRKP